MKTLMAVVLTFAFSLAVMAWAQDNPQSSGSQGQQQQNAQTGQNQSSQNMSGKVSSDAKNFKDDQNHQNYKVDNPSTLQSYEGQHVALVVHFDPDTNTIHIMQVQAAPQQ
jgi:hypothetical protein